MIQSNTFAAFISALKFASVKHQNQRRKNGDIPYINHPIEVASILFNAGVTDYAILCAALLHDTVEDTNTKPEQLQKQFGIKIKNIVMQCTDDKSLDKVERKRIQITKGSKATKQAIQVKLADKISNCYDIDKNPPPSWSKQKVQGYLLWAHAVCKNMYGVNQKLDQPLNEIFKKHGILDLNEEEYRNKLQNYYVILGSSPGQK